MISLELDQRFFLEVEERNAASPAPREWSTSYCLFPLPFSLGNPFVWRCVWDSIPISAISMSVTTDTRWSRVSTLLPIVRSKRTLKLLSFWVPASFFACVWVWVWGWVGGGWWVWMWVLGVFVWVGECAVCLCQLSSPLPWIRSCSLFSSLFSLFQFFYLSFHFIYDDDDVDDDDNDGD